MEMKRIMAAAMTLAMMACGTQKKAASGTAVQASPDIDPKSAAASGPEFAPTALETSESAYWNGHLAFGLSLFSAALKETGDGDNVVISPFSAGAALSMLAEGATGETKEEILNVIHRTSYFSHELRQNSSYIISSANSIWANAGSNVRDEYVKTLQDVYKSDIYVRDFSMRSTVDDMNGWCREKTAGRITEIVDKISPNMMLFLLNALYFKAPWEEPFRKEATRKDVFHSTSGDQDVEFMHITRKFQCGEADGNKYVILPYKSGDYQMIVCLPEEGADIAGLASSIDTSAFLKAVSESRDDMDVALSMPKFKVNATLSLNDMLQSLGIRKAFATGAEFGLMTDAPVAVDKITQKCFMEVNEEGAEAAAVTSVGVKLTSARPPAEKFVMKVDRPFLFAICDVETNDMLFMGKIASIQ